MTVRQSRNLPVLDVLSVKLIDEPHRNPVEEEKISSSTARMRLLGTLLKPPKKNKLVPHKPFVIGLTGGIASGKSGIGQRLKELGADVIVCDKIAHELYQPGKPCYALLVKAFGRSILLSNGKINRKVLSSTVFRYPESIITTPVTFTARSELKKLNSLLWPAVAEELSKRIKNSKSEVVVIETALLLTAGRDKFCHEIWTTLIPQAEAIKRLQIRNGLTEEEALCRIACQCNNRTYIEAASVVFCSQWSVDYTRKQVDKAWALLQTGLLVVSNPQHIGRILSRVQQKVKSTLYIQLLSALSEPLSFHPNLFTSWPKYSQAVWGIYSQAATHCQGLDVRVLLSGLKYKSTSKIQTQKKIELVIFDKVYSQNDIDEFLRSKMENVSNECSFVTLNNEPFEDLPVNNVDSDKTYKHTVLGGTFDRLHIAHKILLSEAALRATSKITVGVTEENMLQSKTLWELVEPIEVRVKAVENFLLDICSELEISVVPIADVFGPTQDDPTMELLVVSAETIKGGQKVNEVRQSKGLPVLDVLSVELIDEPHRNPNEEEKISSSTARMRLLGTLLKPAKPNPLLPNKPYVIGLTGGIASGKSGVAQRLRELGADVIDCDKVAHELYQPGKPCHTLIVNAFGDVVLSNNGEIDRKVLGSIVFKSPNELKKLNSLVWPAIAEDVANKIKNSKLGIVVVEAAVLLTAGWEKMCHEVWVTMVPQAEAIKRLQTRNNLTEEQARSRIASQSGNQTYVEAANVVFCSLWASDYTRSQVDKAWSLMQTRLPS